MSVSSRNTLWTLRHWASVRPRCIRKATEHIPEIIALIQRLVDNGHAYAVNGDVYYRVSGSFPDYGKLSGQSARGS